MDRSFLAVPEHLGFCHILVTMNRVEVNTEVQMLPQNPDLNSFECSSELNSRYHEATSIFSVWESPQSPQWLYQFTHILKDSLQRFFFNASSKFILLKKRVTTSYFRGDISLWFPLTFLRWISDIWSLSACLPWIHESSLDKHLFGAFAYFFISALRFALLLSCGSCLYFFYMKPLSVAGLISISSPTLDCIFIVLIVFFSAVQKLAKLMYSTCLFFAFIAYAFGAISKELLPICL